MSWLRWIALGIIGQVACANAWAKHQIPAYISSTGSASARQSKANGALRDLGIELTLFAKYSDFLEYEKSIQPNFVIAPWSFGRFNPEFQPFLQFKIGDAFQTKYLLLSSSKTWNSGTLKNARVGLVEQSDRSRLSEFVQEITQIKFKDFKSVNRTDDLLLLMVFGSVDVILVSPDEHKHIREKTKTPLFQILETSPVNNPVLFAKKGATAADFAEALKKLPPSSLDPLGFTGVGDYRPQKTAVAAAASAVPAVLATRKVLVARKDSPDFVEVFEGMRKKFSERIVVQDFVVGRELSYEAFKAKVKELAPDLLVLMDNDSVNHGVRYNAEEASKVKSLGLMGLNLKQVLKGNPHVAGIAYETPAYTLLTNFRGRYR